MFCLERPNWSNVSHEISLKMQERSSLTKDVPWGPHYICQISPRCLWTEELHLQQVLHTCKPYFMVWETIPLWICKECSMQHSPDWMVLCRLLLCHVTIWMWLHCLEENNQQLLWKDVSHMKVHLIWNKHLSCVCTDSTTQTRLENVWPKAHFEQTQVLVIDIHKSKASFQTSCTTCGSGTCLAVQSGTPLTHICSLLLPKTGNFSGLVQLKDKQTAQGCVK